MSIKVLVCDRRLAQNAWMSQEPLVFLPNLPMPPTSNNQYKLFLDKRRGTVRHAPAAILAEYRKHVALLRYQHAHYLLDAARRIELKIKAGSVFHVESTFYFKCSDVYNKKGQLKRMDVSNRIKALHDSVCGDLLGMDDKHIFSFSALKIPCLDHRADTVELRITAYEVKKPVNEDVA